MAISATYIPGNGEIIVLNDKEVKRGDGVTQLQNLPVISPNHSWIHFMKTSEYTEADAAYGVTIDMTNKLFTRVGLSVGWTSNDFSTKSFYGKIGRCNMSDDGRVIAYHGDSDYAEDGSNGQVMVQIPKFYYKVIATTKAAAASGGEALKVGTYYVTDKPGISGFKVHPAFLEDGKEIPYIYIGAYEASLFDTSANTYLLTDEQVMDASKDKLCSIANVKPASGLTQSLTRGNCNTMAKNRNSKWHNIDILEISAIQMLMLIEYGSFNSQNVIGSGVTGITDQSSYSCTSLTGSTASLGNDSGRASSTINLINGTSTSYTDANKTSVSWRGIENLWGNIWCHISGMTICGNGSNGGGKPYVCLDRNYSEFSSTSSIPSNYSTPTFALANANGYVNAFGYDSNYDWLFIPVEVSNGANSALPVGDYLYITTDLNACRTALLGGAWSAGAGAGLLCWRLADGVGYRSRSIGGRVAFCSRP